MGVGITKKKLSKKAPEVKKHGYNPSVILVFTRNFVAIVNFYLLALSSHPISLLKLWSTFAT